MSSMSIKDEVSRLVRRKRPLTYARMAEVIRQRHPQARTSVKTVQWYASRLRRSGQEVHVRLAR